jgi:hypothetical protein
LAKERVISAFRDLFSLHGGPWLRTLPLREPQRQRLDRFLHVLDCLQGQIRETEVVVRRRVLKDPRAGLLVTIPRGAALSALTILAEIGDIHRLPSAEHLLSFAGLTPRVRSSGGKTWMVHITKQGPSAPCWVNGASIHGNTIRDNDQAIVVDGNSSNASIYANDILKNIGSSTSGIRVQCYLSTCPSGM